MSMFGATTGAESMCSFALTTTLLFIVYINDLPRCVKHCSVNMYADDTVLYLAGPTVHNLIFHINQDLQCLSEWLKNNKVVSDWSI